MNQFQEILPQEVQTNPFEDIGGRWALVAAGSHKKSNMMTVSWGAVGCFLGAPATLLFVRKHRHTFEFLEKESHYSLNFFPKDYKKALAFCGTNSGRDFDKARETGLTTQMDKDTNTPYFAQADLVYICKKTYAQDMEESGFFDSAHLDSYYQNKDFHKCYIGEIVKVLSKKEK